MYTSRSCVHPSRREFLTVAATAAGLTAGSCGAAQVGGQQATPRADTPPLVGDGSKRRILLRGGVVLTLDPKVGDFEKADVLIDGKKIAQVAPNMSAGDAEIVDCSGTIVMPGFITTHHHQYETLQRSIIAGWPSPGSVAAGDLRVRGAEHLDRRTNRRSPEPEQVDLGPGTSAIRPRGLLHLPARRMPQRDQSGHHHRDRYLAGQPHARIHRRDDQRADGVGPADGVRLQRGDQSERRGHPVRVPWCHQGHHEGDRPDREDVLQLLRSAGDARLRGRPGSRIRRRCVHGMAARPGVRRVDHNHIVGNPMAIVNAAADARNGTDWSDVTFIHATRWQDTPRAQVGYGESAYPGAFRSRAWDICRERGAHISIANLIEMQMRHGMPPFQEALNHGILPSLSPDVDTNMTTDPFSLMRGAFCLQRALANDLAFPESNPGGLPIPQLVTSRQVIEMATIAGAAANRILDKVGTLTPGKEADIIVLDARHINTWPMNNVPGTIVTMMTPSHVRDVLIAGKVVYWKRQHVGWDIDRLLSQIEQARDRVLGRINGPAKIGALPKGLNSFSNPYRPNFLGNCCFKGQNTTAPEYVLRP